MAFDMDGHELWHKNVGTNFDEHNWGTASSPVLCGDMVIVTAASESNSIVALKRADGATGEKVYQERLKAPEAVAETRPLFHLVGEEAEALPETPPAEATDGRRGGYQGPRGPGGGRGGRGRGGGGWFRSQDYASPVVTDGKLYFTRRAGEVFVIGLGREYDELAVKVNKFPGEADYSSTPAIADGEIFIRSSKKLYCVAPEE